MSVAHALIIHVDQKTVIFFGQLDQRQLTEDLISKLFFECENLLIGQHKFLMIDGEQFSASNLEDIVVCLHVYDIEGKDEKKYLNLATYVGKSFKHRFQSEIDEFDGETGDSNAIYGGFGTILGAILKKFLDKDMNATLSSSDVQESLENKDLGAEKGVKKVKRKARFPDGVIPEVERDEILFQEYQEISQLYNVDMMDGLVSKNKVYVYSNVNQYHEIQIDYSNYPEKPVIKLPGEIDDILSLSTTYKNWNKENPARIVDLVTDLEQLLGYQQTPIMANQINSKDVLEYSGSQEEKEGKKVASNLLAKRLLDKEPKTGSPERDMISNEQMKSIEIIESQPVIDKIIEDTEESLKKTPLSEIIAQEKAAAIDQEDTTLGETVEGGQEPKKFKIKPKFHFPGEESIQEGLADGSDAGQSGSGKQKSTTRTPAKPVDLNVLEQKASPTPTKGLNVKEGFVIPGVDELDEYSPMINVKKPSLQVKQAQQKPAPSRQPPAQLKEPPATSRPEKLKKKDDDVMFEWGDDSEEMQISSKREIKDFDFEIKKVDPAKKDNS